MIVVKTKSPNEENAADIAHTLIEENLSAGSTITKTREIYQWGDKVFDHTMYEISIVTNPDKLDAVMKRVKELNIDKEPVITFTGVAGDNFSETYANNDGDMEVTGKTYG